ncbi:barstar family protein [Azoarcus sp. L1K30]|uniref:barstar family protein n=1 Tax=Azoarcus sp. L1K30 TaxID=2820277 RepID=UPI001B82D81A|nr:barstar family protein [Azoarcus sp. L1K30]MBR0568607.1 barstar family protein [Azoarcus sp. L1K30]
MNASTPPIPLTTLLADCSRAGVRPLPPDSANRIAAAATALGFSCARIDLGACADKRALLEQIAKGLDFPDWFGCNWDALADCLDDLSWRTAPGHIVVLERAGAFREHHREDFETLLQILRESATFWAGVHVPLWAFVDLGGSQPA